MKTIKNAGGKYIIQLPNNYELSNKSWPLLFFLHGAGERGNDLETLTTHGPPKIAHNGKEFPFLVLSPQCSKGQYWSNQILIKLLNDIFIEFRIDKSKVYLSGLSMGGFATWSLAINFPNVFAALMPVCGGGNPMKVVKIKDIPCWVFHGAKDNIVPIERSQEMVDAYQKLGTRVKFTVYPEAEHDSWTTTYQNDKLYAWMLKQKK